MSSIFRKDDNYVDKPKRNTFDLSFQNNLTTNFGKIVPVFCQEVLPGDSFKIDTSFGLRYMPQVFPVQTRQRASVKFYYVRNRPLWKGWMDFIGKTKTGEDVTLPYLDFSNGHVNHFYALRPSSLCDYMGVPVKVDVPYGSNTLFHLANVSLNQGTDYTYIPNSSTTLSNTPGEPFAILNKKRIAKYCSIPNDNDSYLLSDIYGSALMNSPVEGFPVAKLASSPISGVSTMGYANVNFALFRKAWSPNYPFTIKIKANGARNYLIVRNSEGFDVAIRFSRSNNEDTFEILNQNISYKEIVGGAFETKSGKIASIVGVMCVGLIGDVTNVEVIEQNIKISVAANGNDVYWSDIALEEIPYYSNVNPDGVRINALPFRAIESIYNALIRNAENNPFKIDGVAEYNKYVTSDASGAATDTGTITVDYHSNWSDDRFTTALPSPQQGNAPLVGLTGVNGATVNLANEDGSNSTIHLQVDSDTGNVVMVDGVSGSDNNPALTHAMMSAVEYGITINDLRNVNSFQRWLENNIRRGYKYKDQLMAHYGVNARYDVLDMPEFIGGVSRDVNVNQVTATATTEDAMLGEYAGQSYVMGDGHSISHYCDEHGFIIGLMDIKPMPLYQDALPKYLTKSDPFDFYFPEFGKIGMQPITKKELSFSMAFDEGDLNGTFGYQRAWYDYLENLDSVHGLFRTDLRNFLLARDFGNMPTLSKSFLTVNKDDVNNTFYVDDDKDKIIGQLYFNVKAKRPIPMIGIPSLE